MVPVPSILEVNNIVVYLIMFSDAMKSLNAFFETIHIYYSIICSGYYALLNVAS